MFYENRNVASVWDEEYSRRVVEAKAGAAMHLNIWNVVEIRATGYMTSRRLEVIWSSE